MKYRDIVSSLACIGLGILFVVGSFNYGDIRKEIPNPGLFPLLGGTILLILSLVNLSILLRKKDSGQHETFFPYRFSLKRLLLAVFSLIVFVVALEYLGYIIASLLLTVFLLRFIEPQKWAVNLTTSVLVTTFFYMIFIFLLKVQLPKGILFK